MALILNIDTATEKASVCLSRDGNTLALEENLDQKDHASWLHTAIAQAAAVHRLRGWEVSRRWPSRPAPDPTRVYALEWPLPKGCAMRWVSR